MKASGKPGIAVGLLIAAMLTAALLGILFLAWRVVGLPFVPFDVFDRATRLLPGRVIAFGIDTMVTVIRALNLGQTSATAKLAEQSMGVAGVFFAGTVAGGVLFVIVRALRGRYVVLFGLIVGALLGLPAMLISFYASGTAETPPVMNAVWVLGIFLLWGVLMALATQRLIDAGGALKTSGQKGVDATETIAKRINRRRFVIRVGASTAAITVVGAVVGELAETRRRKAMLVGAGNGRWSATHSLPNAEATVKAPPGTRPEFTPLEQHYRIDINSIPPSVAEHQWRLRISGLLEKPLALNLEQLRGYEPLHQFITLSCISNPVGGDLIGTTRWTGVSLQRLLPDLGLKPNATHLKIRAVDDFFEVVPLETIRGDERVMLAYAWDGVPLTQDHGFPLRIYIPDVHGMKQPKWIESIEAIDRWDPGYWVKRGWSKVARMKATSVIDTVATDMSIVQAGPQKRVAIGGMAHAGARGISKVEVQVDDGPWEQALLRTPLSPLTWVMWRYDWAYQPGKHTFTVRCQEGDGTPQITTPNPAEPDGASGLHSKMAVV